jgi:peptide/nickel transport system permease protein
MTTQTTETLKAFKAKRWYQDGLLLAGVVIVSTALFLSVFGYIIAPYDPGTPVGPISQPPSREFWFGTDSSGLDVFSRVITAPRIDVTLAVSAALLSGIIGTLIGLGTGF